MHRIQGAKPRLSFKIVSLAETDLSELLSFGAFSLMAMAQEIFKETEQSTGIHGSSVQLLHTHKPDKRQISDLDMLIIAVSTENTEKLMEIVQTHTNTRAFTLKNETGEAFGFQVKGVHLGGTPLNFSLTIYTTPPTDPIYDDIAHSEILWLTPRYHLTSKFPDIPFIQHLKEHRLLLTPPNESPQKQIFRIAMREAKGWKIHTSEMDKRVYESGASYWSDPYLMGTGINATWIDHFDQEDREAYPRLVFFMLSRHLRHNQDTEKNRSLWQCLSATLARTTHPQTVKSMAELATHLQIKHPNECDFHRYLHPFKNHQADCLSLCAAWDACQTSESRNIIRSDLRATLTQISRNALSSHDECPMPSDESAWQATLRHIGYHNGHARQIPDPLFSRVISPTLTHVTDIEKEQFIHDQLSSQCVSTTQYGIYITEHQSDLESWLCMACATTEKKPNSAIIYTACKLIASGIRVSEITQETLFLHLDAGIKSTSKPEEYYTLWAQLLQTATLTLSTLDTIEKALTQIKNWGYPDEALLPPILDRLMNDPPTHKPWPTQLEILCLAHIRPTPHPKLDAYTKSLFSTPDWHYGFRLHESLSHIQHGFPHKPKLKEKLSASLLDVKNPSNIQDAKSALTQWTQAACCPHNPAWLNSVAYLLSRNSLPQAAVLEKLWAMTDDTTWHTGFFQNPKILSAVIAHQVRKDPPLIPQVPDLHRRFNNLIMDEDTQVYVLNHATDATLVQCLEIYIWNTNPLSTKLCDYRRAFINDTKRHTPLVQTALREQAQKQQSTDITLSLSIWINLPDSDDAILSNMEQNPRVPETRNEIYSAAISKLLKSNSPPIKVRRQAILDRLDFDKMDSSLKTQLLAEMTETQRLNCLEHDTKQVRLLSTDQQKSLLETVVYEDCPILTSTLIAHLSQTPILSVIKQSLTHKDAHEKASHIIEIALIQRKISRSALSDLFETYSQILHAPSEEKHPKTYRAWTEHQTEKATQHSIQQQEKDTKIYKATLHKVEITIKKATSDHLKNKDIDRPSLGALKTLFLDSPPAQKQQLLRDCPSLETLPFYLQDIDLLQTMSAIVGEKPIITPPSAVGIAIKADNLEFMTHLHRHGLSLYFSCTDHATNSSRTLLDFAIHYKRPHYYRYLFNARQVEIQAQEQAKGTLVLAAICGKLENLHFLLQHGHYDKSPAACAQRIRNIFTVFHKLGLPNFQWNPVYMLPKAQIIEGLRWLVQADYLPINTPLSVSPEMQDQHPVTIALGTEAYNTVNVTTNGLSYLLLQAAESQPNNAQLGALFLAYAIHHHNTNYAHEIESKLIKQLEAGISLTPHDFKGLFKLFPDFISGIHLIPLLNIILKHQKEVLLANQNEHNPFAAITLASPLDHTPVRLLLDAGLSPNERSHQFHLSHLLLRYATADMFEFLVSQGLSVSEWITAADIIPTLPPLRLNAREYLYFVTPLREKNSDFRRKDALLTRKGIHLSSEIILALRLS